MESYKNFLNEERKHKYNSIAKIKKVLGNGQPSDDTIKAFIKKEYDLDNEDHMDIVGDIMGYYHLDPEEFFDEDGNLLEATVNEAKSFGDVYEVATPNPTSALINALKKSKILKNAEIVTNFNSPDNLESVLVFGATESEVRKAFDEFGDVLIFKYELVNRTELLESKLDEGKESSLMVKPSTDKDFKALKKWIDKSDYYAEEEKGYFIFPEEDLDALEMELTKDFDKAGISASFEAM